MNEVKEFNPVNFKDMVFGTDDSFTLVDGKDGSRIIHFIQDKIGNAKYIYAAYDWREGWEYEINHKFTLMAIVSGWKIYVVDDIIFELSAARFWKENGHNYKTKGFEDDSAYIPYQDYVNEFFEYVENELLPFAYANIEVEPDTERYIHETRVYLFRQGEKHPTHLIKNDGEYNPALVLCGNYGRMEYGNKIINDHIEMYQARKIEELSIEKHIADGTAAEEWEIRLAKAIKDSGAKSVIVEFEHNGKVAAEKAECERILYNLREKGKFSEYNFVTSVAGEKLFKALGIEDKWNSGIYCSDITRIVFRGKDIYKKE